MFEKILSSYQLSADATISPYGSGLIHRTWRVSDPPHDYILQKINHHVFKQPQQIAHNINAIATFLKEAHPEYFFIAPIRTKDSQSILFIPGDGHYRLFPFVNDSYTYDIVTNPDTAFEAARQFGLFTHVLGHFSVDKLKITLPHFHDLEQRYQQFEETLQKGNVQRVREAAPEIDFIRSHDHIVTTYRAIISGNEFRQRVTHHDTKISNVLFDANGKGICVIDLDTVMPGYFLSDAGDMMRTYLSPVSEEEKEFEKIIIREDYFRAIVKGYLAEMGTELTEIETDHFVYAGMFMIYMQAMRFLTDHLNNDVYYGALYDGHNYIRAKNQLTLLQRFIEKEEALKEIVFEEKAGMEM
jgi:Ser/Thr protein kinase RdoA (MazF antagonist)